MGGEALEHHEGQVRDLLERLTARAENLKEQSTAPEPQPLEFNDKGEAPLDGWVARQETGDAGLEDQQEEGKPRLLMIQCGEGGKHHRLLAHQRAAGTREISFYWQGQV